VKRPTEPRNERRVYRQIAFPVSAFDVLQDLKRTWALGTNGEVLTRLLVTEGQRLVKKNAEPSRSAFDLA
jgi:hypothetical protein